MLTQKDFDQIETIIDQKLEEKLKILPSKDEFFIQMGKLMKELQDLRKETTVLPQQIADLKDKVETLETLTPG